MVPAAIGAIAAGTGKFGNQHARPNFRKALEARSFVIDATGPAEFQKFIDVETVKWRKVITDAKIMGD